MPSLRVVAGAVFSAVLGSYAFAQPANDCNNDPEVLSIGVTPFSTIGATTDGPAACVPIGADIWFVYTAGANASVTISTCGNANFNTVLVLYDGAVGIGPTIACNDNFCGVLSQLTFASTIGHSYKLRVGGFGGAMGSGQLVVSQSGGGPPNDNCGNAISISDGTTAFSTLGATTDGPVACATMGADIWFTYTPAMDGQATAVTCSGTGFDTVLVVYSGAGCVGSSIACNDNSCGQQSQVSFAATAGQSYKIRIGGAGGATGTGNLSVGVLAPMGACCLLDYSCIVTTEVQCTGANGSYRGNGTVCPMGGCPFHDACAAATAVGDGVFSYNNSLATTDGPPVTGCGSASNAFSDLWYRYTAAVNGMATIDTCGSGSLADTVLAVYAATACPPAAGSQLACNDDFAGCASGGTLRSQVTVAISAGAVYLVRVGSFGSAAQGTGTLNIASIAFQDCNENGINDAIDIQNGTSRDCNRNAEPDECEIAAGAADSNHNAILDECEPACSRIERSGDWDGDCDIDLLDYSAFQICMPRHSTSSSLCQQDGCKFADLNYDNVTDLGDLAAFVASFTGPGQSLANCDPNAGSCDAWATGLDAGLPFGGTYYVFGNPIVPPPGYDGSNPPIPGGFFGPGSLPFDGVIILGGQPGDLYNLGTTDTIIEHPPLRFGFGDLPFCDIVPARLESLSLRSRDPIVVPRSSVPDDCNGNGQSDSTDIATGVSVDQNANGVPDECEWYVGAEPSIVPAPDGSIEACKTHANGGTFDATIYIQPMFVFVNKAALDAGSAPSVDNIKVLDTGAEGLPPIIFHFEDQPFSICGPASGTYITPCAQGNFVPGVDSSSPFSPPPTTCLSPHISPGERHYFCPPECRQAVCTYPAIGAPFGRCFPLGCGGPVCAPFPPALMPGPLCSGPNPAPCPPIGFFLVRRGVCATPPCLFPIGLCIQFYGPPITCTPTGNFLCP